MPGADCCATIDTRNPCAAQQVGRAIAVDADQVGHHVTGAILAAIDEQSHLRGARVGRRILGDDDIGRVVARRESRRSVAVVTPSCVRRICAARSDSPISFGATTIRGPELTHRSNAALPPRGRTRRRILAEHVAGRDLRIWPAALVDPRRPGRDPTAIARASSSGLPDQLGHADLAGADSHAHGDGGKDEKRRDETAGEQQQLAGAPDSGSRT